MAPESPTSPNSDSQADKTRRCARKQCECEVKQEKQFCSDSCEQQQTAMTKQCDCNHDACIHCANRECKCQVAERGHYCSDVCADKSVTTKYCYCTHDSCYRECDLVMKGGITSGIVYPPLVYKLYEDNYRFRSIGGTSAGAIAAAVTAAAEYGRDSGGFEKLNEVKKQLASGTFLRDLFQPTKETRPLFDILLGAAEVQTGRGGVSKKTGVWRKALEVVHKLEKSSKLLFLLFYVGGALLGLFIALGLGRLVQANLNAPALAALILFGLTGAILGYLFILAQRLWRLYKILTRAVPENFFGMCTGLKDDSVPDDKEVLTNWLNDRINDLAGIRDKTNPLTFGMLSRKKFVRQLDDDEGIQLRMVTSNLSQNQPYVLPFNDHLLIYKEADFKKFFPKEVVEYMKGAAAKRPPYDLSELKGYFFLPEAVDLPVIVATRLSLSFPLLLCALPLYTIVPQKVEEANESAVVKLQKNDLKKNWFSDGGIASNFPIQFFDSWLPTRPTFGVNLVALPEECFKGEFVDEAFGRESNMKLKEEFNSPIANPASPAVVEVTGQEVGTPAGDKNISKAIYLPKADDPLYTEWLPLTEKPKQGRKQNGSLIKFLWAIFTTAQNYRDNMQAMLPSYRERIVQIRLSKEEGGLNLAMPEPTIQRVIEKGEEAGRVLRTDFDFNIHQWVRFQVLMSQMEKYLEKTWRVAREDPEMGTRQFDYPKLMKTQEANKYPYRREPPWCENATARMKAMGNFIEGWQKEPKLSEQPPLPESVLRATPEL